MSIISQKHELADLNLIILIILVLYQNKWVVNSKSHRLYNGIKINMYKKMKNKTKQKRSPVLSVWFIEIYYLDL